jgi:hypothetical protein
MHHEFITGKKKDPSWKKLGISKEEYLDLLEM